MQLFPRNRSGDSKRKRHRSIMLLGIGPVFVILVLIIGWFYFYGRQLLHNPSRLLPYMIVALVLGVLLLAAMD